VLIFLLLLLRTLKLNGLRESKGTSAHSMWACACSTDPIVDGGIVLLRCCVSDSMCPYITTLFSC